MTNFWKALETVDISNRVVEHEYRLYYDPETGTPLHYSMDKPPGTYIIVSKDQYNHSRYDFIIMDGKIKYPDVIKFKRLEKTENGTPCHPDNIMIIDSTSKVQWILKTHTTE